MSSHDDVFARVSRSGGVENGEGGASSSSDGLLGGLRQRSRLLFQGPLARAFREDFTIILALYVLPTIMRLAVLRGMLSAARRLTIRSELIRGLSQALESEERTYQLENAWDLQKGSRTNADARPLDAELDRSLSAFARLLSSTAESLDASHPRCGAARRLLASLFPNGVGAITQQGHQAQSAAVAALLARTLKPSVSKDLAALGFEDQIDRLARIHADFDRALQAGTALDFSELERQRDRGRRALGALIFRILGTYYGEDAESREIREALMGPVLFHNELRRRSLRRRRPRSASKPKSEEA